jgi:hypothetical protein
MRTLHIADPDCPETKTGYVTTPPAGLLCAADHPARPVEWLWQDRIPLGKVTLLAGDPGLGKSLLALDLAARLSRAIPFPTPQPPALPGVEQPNVDQPNNNPSEPTANRPHDSAPDTNSNPRQSRGLKDEPAVGSTLILSSSDDYHDTIRPRLDAAGADPSRVFYLPTIRDLRQDLAQLREAVESIPDCRLIIVDPINAYVGPSDAHFHTVVRRVLEPLAQLAAEKSLAILAITHLNKSDGAAIQRAAGSMGFVAAARTIWTLVRDPDDSTRTLLLPLKNNLAQSACGLAFQITSGTGTTGCPQPVCEAPEASQKRESTSPPPPAACDSLLPAPCPLLLPPAPRLLWHPTPVTLTPREAFHPKPTTLRRPTDREQAVAFLREALAGGPRPANELIEAGEGQGLHRRTIQRAFHDLEGHTAKRGWTAGWWWSIGEYRLDVPPENENLSPQSATKVTYAQDVSAQLNLDEADRQIERHLAEFMSPSQLLSPSTTAPVKSPTLDESLAYFNQKMNGHDKKPKPK